MVTDNRVRFGIAIPQIFGGPRVDTSLCAIVAELSRLLDEPGLWADLLGHLKQVYGKKRLIWETLEAEGCPLA